MHSKQVQMHVLPNCSHMCQIDPCSAIISIPSENLRIIQATSFDISTGAGFSAAAHNTANFCFWKQPAVQDRTSLSSDQIRKGR